MFDLPVLLHQIGSYSPLGLVLFFAYSLVRERMRMRHAVEIAELLKKHPEHAAAIIDVTFRRSLWPRRSSQKSD